MSGIREQKKRETKKEILQAAIRLFGQKGFEKTSVSDLAAAAGVGKGTIYGYFKTKDAIFLAFCEEEMEMAFAALKEQSDSDGHVLEQLFTLFFSQYRFVTENPDFGRVLLREMAFPARGMMEASKPLNDQYFKAVGKIVEAGIQRGELRKDTDVFLATVQFFALYQIILSGFYTGYIFDEEEAGISMRVLFTQALEGFSSQDREVPKLSEAEALIMERIKQRNGY